jgi:hypothetical protein
MEGQVKTRLNIPIVCAVLAAGVFTTFPAFSAHREGQQNPPAAAKPADAAQRPASPDNAGAMKFKQNCARCHEAPQGFSPRIAGTILRHMRVRANLSAQDERDILHFLNP